MKKYFNMRIEKLAANSVQKSLLEKRVSQCVVREDQIDKN